MHLKISDFLFFIFFLISLCGYGQDYKNLSIDKNQAIDSILINKVAYNLAHPSLGYSIQIYYGNETLAYKFKEDFEAKFPEQLANISFASPDWKVMVGNFRTRIEADQVMLTIKQSFNSAVVVLTPFTFE